MSSPNRQHRVSLLAQLVSAGAAGLSALVCTVFTAPAAHAATSGGTTTANVTVGSAVTLSNLSPSFTLTGNPGDSPTSTVTMTVTTNNAAGYTVTVEPTTTDLAATTTGNTATIPFTSISVRETGTPTYASLTPGTPLEVYRKTSPSAAAGDALSNDYTITVPFVPNDTYTGKIDYVATTL